MHETSQKNDGPRSSRISWPPVLKITAISIFGAVCLTVIAVLILVTAVRSSIDTKVREAQRQADQIQTYLNLNSNAYSNISVHQHSAGYAIMSGTVQNRNDLDTLHAEMDRLFGTSYADAMVEMVEITNETIKPELPAEQPDKEFQPGCTEDVL